jgi:uncharacterized protein
MSETDATEVSMGVARPGGLSYMHLPATDVRRAARFYGSVFGWTIWNPDSDRPGFEDGTGHVGGAWMRNQAISTTPGLLPYIYVIDIREAVSAITRDGGEIVTPPYREGTLWVATFRDPEGNVMGVWQQG